jgi:hypothetical protein
MSGGRASFEVQGQSDERWVIEDQCDSEAAARTAATALAAKRAHRAVRIIKYWKRADGVVTETVLFQQALSAPEVKVAPAPIEDTPYCKKIRDYYKLESRDTIGRLFRKYLEKVILTPTELLHSSKALKRVQEVDTLFPPAIDRVATLQARQTQEDPRTRRDELYKAVTQMAQRARKTEDIANLPSLRRNDFAKMISEIERLAPPNDSEYYALVVLARDLMEHNSWLAKLDRLAELTSPDLPDQSLALLDGVYADLFGVPTALQDILGQQRNLAEALMSIADLCEGKLVTLNPDLTEVMALLNRLMAEGRLPETRKSLIDRLQRQLGGSQPLARNDSGQEGEALRKLCDRLVRPEGLFGGPATAEALTRRAVLFQEAGGKTGLKKAVESLVATLPDVLLSVLYLRDLSASGLAADLGDAIEVCVSRELKVESVDRLAPPKLSPTDKMRLVTRLYNEVRQGETLPSDLRHSVLDHLDGLLVRYIEAKGIIEKLDDPLASLRNRTIRLLEFSAAGVFPNGSEAHRIARDRIVAILRQPNFELHFIEGITQPAEAEKMLRHLHGLLSKGGYRLSGGSAA